MNNILVYSDDVRFGKTCANELKSEGYAPHVVSTEKGVVEFLKKRSGVDLVILNEGSERQTSHHMLETLRSLTPKVSVIMAADCFNYWNDFSTWLADACLVKTPDLAALKETVKDLLRQSQPSGKAGTSEFSVDMA